jgi:serine/threonine-protein kinase
VLTALRREPERRYASAAALGEDLERFLEGRPIRARADTAGYRVRKFVQRHRVGVIATVLVLLSLLGGLGVALWQAAEAEAQARRAQVLAQEAEAQARRAERQALRAQQVKNFLVGVFEDASPQRARSGTQMRVAELVEGALARLERDLADAPEARAELRITLGGAQFELGDEEAARVQIEAGIGELRALPDSDPAALGRSLGRLAIVYNALGRADESERLVREGIAILERLPGDHTLERIQLRTSLAKQASLRKDLDLAETLYEEILVERRALLGPDHSGLAVDWNNLAAMALRRDRFDEARDAYGEALRLLLADADSPESRQAWVRAGLAAASAGLGDYGAAERELRKALEIAERTLHAEHGIIGSIRVVWANLLRQQNRFAEAEAQARAALAIYAPQNHSDQASGELQLGLALLGRDDLTAADAALADAERLVVERRSRDETLYWHAQSARALIARRRGDVDATERLDAALRGFVEHGLDRTMAYGESLLLRAEVARLDRDPAHREWQQRARERLTEVLGAAHPRLGMLR